MKKFKDLIISTGSDANAIEALVQIENACKGSTFLYSESIENLYSQNDHIAHIVAKLSNLPDAVLIVFANDATVKVLNIVPWGKSTDQLTKTEYNTILDTFANEIISPLFPNKYKIVISPDEVVMKDLIPESFNSLNAFVNCPGKQSPFSHPLDRERWFEFICTLTLTGEYLSSGDLELYLLEDEGWDANLVEDVIGRFEDATDLLNYYVSYND